MSSIRFLIISFILLPLMTHAQKIKDKKAESIIESCISAHGGKKYKKFDISFDFRQFRFNIKINNGTYYYERAYTDSTGNKLKDMLSNGLYTHKKNGVKTELTPKMEDRYREGLNSVVYFLLLPYKLKDQAVNAQYLESAELGGEKYDKLKVWFDKEGGGKDHEDIYCFWINQKTHTLDYLAYANGGPRFRKWTKRDIVAGIVFQNYDNYQILDKEIHTHQYDKAYSEGKFKLLSKIEQSNYLVNK